MRIAPSVLILCIILATVPAAAATGNGDTSDLSLGLAKVALYAQQDKLDEALQLIEQLKARYPDNAQVLASEAEVDFRIGNRGAAFAALNRANELDPTNEDILARQRTALLEQGQSAGAGYMYRHTSESNENIINGGGQVALSQSLSAQLSIQNDYIKTDPITNPYGVAHTYGSDRGMENLTIGKVWHNGDEASASFYGNDSTACAGAQYSAWDNYGATTLQGNLNKPDWDYPVLVVENGTKDNILLERREIITPHFQVTAGGGYNRYNLEDENNVAGAAAWNLNAAYNQPVSGIGKSGSELTVGAAYTVEAEYFTHMLRDIDDTGAIYKPFPINSYEIHSLELTASKSFTPQVYSEGFAGYSIDRLGGNGPLFGASLVYSPIDHLGIELRGSHSLLGGIGTGTSEEEDILALNIKWHW